MNRSSRASVRVKLASCLAVGAVAAATLVAGPGGVVAGDAGPDAQDLRPVANGQPRGTASFQIASFNLLGAGHTDKKNGRKGFARSDKRLNLTKQIVASTGTDVIGFQEMHLPQAQQWGRDQKGWETFPGTARSRDAGRFSISWRSDVFSVVRKETIQIPYFGGKTLPMPYVLLKHRATGQQAWFHNVHNPANVNGNQTKWRVEAVRREAALINRLKAQSPEIPVFMTGDMNDRKEFFCSMTSQAPVIASAGGHRGSSGGCVPPGRMDVDWVLSTRDNTFTSHVSLRDSRVRQASDHPYVYANANIASPTVRSAKVDRVVVVSAGGLGGRLLANAPAWTTRELRKLMRAGASTTWARTAPETALTLPNQVSMLTGRRVNRAAGGHGVNRNADSGRTVHAAAGRYTSSAFDLAHNFGMRTAFFSPEPRSALVRRSWDAANGGGDPFGPDNGKNKIDVKPVLASDEQVTTRAVAGLRTSPARLTVVELSGLAGASAKHSFRSKGHLAALRDLDRRIGRISAAINGNPAVAGRTMLVVAGTTGDKVGRNATERKRSLHRVPMIVRGPGLARNTDLYRLNPAYRNTTTSVGHYAAGGPILVGSVANLATNVLRLPPIPGSQVNTSQSLNVFPLR